MLMEPRGTIMNINFKEYLIKSVQNRRNEIIEYKDMIAYMDKLGNCNVKAESIREMINQQQSLLYAWETILDEL